MQLEVKQHVAVFLSSETCIFYFLTTQLLLVASRRVLKYTTLNSECCHQEQSVKSLPPCMPIPTHATGQHMCTICIHDLAHMFSKVCVQNSDFLDRSWSLTHIQCDRYVLRGCNYPSRNLRLTTKFCRPEYVSKNDLNPSSNI